MEIILKYSDEYPDCPPQIIISDSEGLTTGDIVLLNHLLTETADNNRGKFMSDKLVQLTVDYVSAAEQQDAVLSCSSTGSARVVPYIPREVNLATCGVQPSVLNLQDMPLEEVERQLRAGVSRAVQEMGQIVLDFENIVSVRLLRDFSSRLRDLVAKQAQTGLKDYYYPTIGFHGSEFRNVESITESGLLCPYDLTQDGKMIHVATGKVWGQGIYTSPKLRVASDYTTSDANGRHQIFVALVALGRPCIVTPEWQKEYDFYGRCVPPPGYDSVIPPNNWAYVVFDSSSILPVLLVTYGPKGSAPLPVPLALAKPDSKLHEREVRRQAAKQWRALQRKKVVSDKKGEEFLFLRPCVYALKVPSTANQWILPIEGKIFTDFDHPGSFVHLFYILDKSASMGGTFEKLLLPACEQTYFSINPDSASVILFGETVDVHRDIKSGHFFSSPAVKSMQLQDATDILGGFSKALDVALEMQEKFVIQDLESAFSAILKQDTAEEQREQEEIKKELLIAKKHGIEYKSESAPEQHFKRIARMQRYLRSIRHQGHIFLFLLMSDGDDTVNSETKIDKTLEQYYNCVQGCGIHTIFSLVGIGKDSNTNLGSKLVC